MAHLLIKIALPIALLSVGLTQYFTGYPAGLFVSMHDGKIYHGDFYIKPGSTETDISTRHSSLYMKDTQKTYEQLDEALAYNKNEFTRRVYDDHEKPLYQYIADHTFKLTTPCNQGTGWIMDFEIPQSPKTYPTTWYIATNMHVVRNAIFSNPYGLIPSTKHTTYPNTEICKRATTQQNPLILSRTTIPIGQEYELEKQDGSSSNVKIKSNVTPDKSADIKDPKLIYHAFNFAGDRYDEQERVIKNNNYYKDFAVVEVTFDSETIAKDMTDDYYTKYYKSPKNGDKPVNLFAPELLYSKTPEQLSKIEAFTGGYSVDDDKHFSTNAISKKHVFETLGVLDVPILQGADTSPTKMKTTMFYEKHWSDTRDNGFLMNKKQQPIIGHRKSIAISLWDGLVWGWGYELVFKNAFVISGDSGSMAIDKDKNLLGIFKTVDLSINAGNAIILKSEGIFDGKKIISPKFDFIRGVEGQPMSYKSQLEKFHPNMTTYLTSINWGRPKE